MSFKRRNWFRLFQGDIYHFFWEFWSASASQCGSGSCPLHTPRICPLLCRSPPPYRSLHAAEGEEHRQTVRSQRSITRLLRRLRLWRGESDVRAGDRTSTDSDTVSQMIRVSAAQRHNSTIKTSIARPATSDDKTLCPRQQQLIENNMYVVMSSLCVGDFRND